MLKENSLAPDFSLPDQEGKVHKLSDYKGTWVLLYFYPKDNTPGCTKEACMIRDYFPSFEGLGAKVLGISSDSVESHKKFAKEFLLLFPLLSDTEKKAISLYAAKGVLFTKRISYLISPDGKIAKAYDNVNPAIHAKQVLEDLGALKGA
jgi:thioredoxin-dependent peroxiredoxin